jgi:hypothetical protein
MTLCVNCMAFCATKESNYLCSYCSCDFVKQTMEEKEQFQQLLEKKTIPEIISNQLKINTLNKTEFNFLAKLCKNQTYQELYCTLLGERDFPRSYLSRKQATTLYELIKKNGKPHGYELELFNVVLSLFCFETCKFEPDENFPICEMGTSNSMIPNEDSLIIFLKSWKYKKLIHLKYRDKSNIQIFVTICHLCPSKMNLYEDFDDCVECHRLMCFNCTKDARRIRWLFGNTKEQLRICKYCDSKMHKTKDKVNDIYFHFQSSF